MQACDKSMPVSWDDLAKLLHACNTCCMPANTMQKPPCPICVAHGASLDSFSFFVLGLQLGAIHSENLPDAVARYMCGMHRPTLVEGLVRVAEVFRQVQA